MNDNSEKTFLQEGMVKITDRRTLIGTDAYLVAEITSVSVARRARNKRHLWFLLPGLLFILWAEYDQTGYYQAFFNWGVVLCAIGLALTIAATVLVLQQENVQALSVNEVASDPAAFTGTITVTGVTYGFARQDPSLFGIMDVKELQCQSPNCNKLILPVKYRGTLPAVGDEVRLTGSFVNAAGGYLFAAEEVKVLRNHKLGGQG